MPLVRFRPAPPPVGGARRFEVPARVDIFARENLFDLFVLLLLVAAFVIGYLQGTVRRLLGIASVIVSPDRRGPTVGAGRRLPRPELGPVPARATRG